MKRVYGNFKYHVSVREQRVQSPKWVKLVDKIVLKQGISTIANYSCGRFANSDLIPL